MHSLQCCVWHASVSGKIMHIKQIVQVLHFDKVIKAIFIFATNKKILNYGSCSDSTESVSKNITLATYSFGYKMHSSFKQAVHVSHEFAHSVHSWSQPSPLGPGPSQFSKHGKQGSQLRHSVSHWSQAVWYPSISSSWVLVILPNAHATKHDKNLIKRFILKRSGW